MTRIVAILAVACGLTLAACKDQETEEKLARARTDLALAEAESKSQRDLAGKLSKDLDQVRGELRAATDRLNAAQQQVDEAAAKSANTAELTALRDKVAKLEAETRRLEAELATRPAASTTDKPAEPPADKQPAAADPEAVKQAQELLGKVKANPTDYDTVEKLAEALRKADASTREKAIADLKAIVAADPRNKEARLALASVMVTRFRDLRNPMDQGALAAEIKTELDKAIDIDPGYYEAQHFLALMKTGYPPFTEEFKTANKDLDRAIELQSKMTWDDSFSEIYAAYAGWYRRQGKLEEAAAKVQAGLDKDPRNEDLLAEKKRIDDARAAKEGSKE